MAEIATITAHRNGDSREFTKEVWDQLPANKYGWVAAVDAPDEVKNLTGTTPPPAAGDGHKPNAAELAKQIYAAETAEAVDALVQDGETRVTVLKAAEDRKKQLSEPQ